MKRCPTCNRSYADNTLSFCLQDGARLEPDYDPEATVVSQPRPPVTKPRESSNHSGYQIIIVLLLLILAGAGIGFYLMLNKKTEQITAAATPSPEPSRGDP